jgi:hypothetical protein
MNPTITNMMEEGQTIQEEERDLIIKLGREFVQTIKTFANQNKLGSIKAKIVIAALDYVIKLYKNRLAAVGEDFLMLEKIVKERGLGHDEPYSKK